MVAGLSVLADTLRGDDVEPEGQAMGERTIIVEGVEIPCPAYEVPVVGDAVLLLAEEYRRESDGEFGTGVVVDLENYGESRPGCVVRVDGRRTEHGDPWEDWMPLADLGLIATQR